MQMSFKVQKKELSSLLGRYDSPSGGGGRDSGWFLGEIVLVSAWKVWMSPLRVWMEAEKMAVCSIHIKKKKNLPNWLQCLQQVSNCAKA